MPLALIPRVTRLPGLFFIETPRVAQNETERFMSSKFLDYIATQDKPVLADFWAEWCGPCRMMHPVLEELSKDWKGKATVVKVNSDEQPDLAQRFDIHSLPTLILFSGGKEVHRVSGARPASALKAEFARWIG
jgi:thioredoxin 1